MRLCARVLIAWHCHLRWAWLSYWCQTSLSTNRKKWNERTQPKRERKMSCKQSKKTHQCSSARYESCSSNTFWLYSCQKCSCTFVAFARRKQFFDFSFRFPLGVANSRYTLVSPTVRCECFQSKVFFRLFRLLPIRFAIETKHGGECGKTSFHDAHNNRIDLCAFNFTINKLPWSHHLISIWEFGMNRAYESH